MPSFDITQEAMDSGELDPSVFRACHGRGRVGHRMEDIQFAVGHTSHRWRVIGLAVVCNIFYCFHSDDWKDGAQSSFR